MRTKIQGGTLVLGVPQKGSQNYPARFDIYTNLSPSKVLFWAGAAVAFSPHPK
jgi:hypothetical protein